MAALALVCAAFALIGADGGCNVADPNIIVDNALGVGLAPEANTPHNLSYLRGMTNMRAMGSERRAVAPDLFTQPVDVPIQHPFPQLFNGERGRVLASADAIEEVNATYERTPVTVWQADNPTFGLEVVAGGPWQQVFFDSLYFLSNGETFIFNLPIGEGDVLGTTDLKVNALGRHGTRLLLGGITGDWLASDRFQTIFQLWRESQPESWGSHEDMTFDVATMVYSEPGGGADDIPYTLVLAMLGVLGESAFDKYEAEILTAIENGSLGFVRIPQAGSLMAFKEFGLGVAAYGEGSVTRLDVAGLRYEPFSEEGLGITGRCAVDGGKKKHVYVDPESNLWEWPVGGSPARVGHSAYLETARVLLPFQIDADYDSSTKLACDATYIVAASFNDDAIYVYTIADQALVITIPANNVNGVAVFNNELYAVVSGGIEVFSLPGGVSQRSWVVPSAAFEMALANSEVYTLGFDGLCRVFNLAGVQQRSFSLAGGGENAGRFAVSSGGIAAVTFPGIGLGHLRIFSLTGVAGPTLALSTNNVQVAADATTVYVSVLTPSAVDFYDFSLNSLGSQEVVPSPENSHAICVNEDYLFVANVDNPITIYAELIASGAKTLVLYDSKDEDFWISNGKKTHVLSSGGLAGPFDLQPTSLYRDGRSALVGIARNADQEEFTFTVDTNLFDTGNRDYKRFTGVQVTGFNLRELEGRADYRFDSEGDLEEGYWNPSAAAGFVRLNQSFIEGAVGIRGVYTNGAPAAIGALSISYAQDGETVAHPYRK